MTNKASVNSVKVRMYRQGFGDCFLLSFYQDDNRIFTMLIDCGIKYNTKSDEAPIEKIVEDLKQTLTPEGETTPQLDVLVATHEHWDHISFFHPTRFPDFFADFQIGQVWLAWTEDPDDDEAKQINSRLRDGAVALQMAASRLNDTEGQETQQTQGFYFGEKVAGARQDFNTSLNDVLGFYGVTSLKKISDSGIKYNPDGSISSLTQQSMERIIELGGDRIRYFNPGTTVDSSLLPLGIRVHVLGPPRSSLINKSNPSRGHAHETYLSIDHSGMTSFIDGLFGMAQDKGERGHSSRGAPFGSDVGVTADEAASEPYFANTYFREDEAYRRIENNWLDIAGQFALQLDGAINNTSLVLAIELTDSGKVLLFPGDAQVGSWLSWHDHEWEVREGCGVRKRSAADLLNNTVLYKVSHHGSHNATIRDKGLEMMTHAELVAMIPEKEDSYNGILYEPLMERLKQLCKGRVMVSADSNCPPEDLMNDRPALLSECEWNTFKDNLKVDRLYLEYTVR
ncbi:MAG: hypothetical protein RIK87_26360 [Fuerstiella sp.]